MEDVGVGHEVPMEMPMQVQVSMAKMLLMVDQMQQRLNHQIAIMEVLLPVISLIIDQWSMVLHLAIAKQLMMTLRRQKLRVKMKQVTLITIHMQMENKFIFTKIAIHSTLPNTRAQLKSHSWILNHKLSSLGQLKFQTLSISY